MQANVLIKDAFYKEYEHKPYGLDYLISYEDYPNFGIKIINDKGIEKYPKNIEELIIENSFIENLPCGIRRFKLFT